MGNERSNTYLANATGSPIRVYYNVDTLVPTEAVVTVGATAGNKGGSAIAGGGMTFKRDSRIRYIRIPANEFSKFAGEGTIYASVFVEGSSYSDQCVKAISENFKVPSDRSLIVTADCSIKFQKYGESIWMDEQGKMHR